MRLGSWLRLAYVRTREPAGYVLIILAIIGGLSSNPKLQVGAVGILVGMALRLLFEIHRHTEARTTATSRVKSVADARDTMERCLKAGLKEDGFVRIQWIGMTMFNVWNTMEAVFDWLAEDVRARTVRFEVAMLESSWLDQNQINPAWTGKSAEMVADKIGLYTEGQPKKLQGLDWVFEIHCYAHMPAIHGGLINGKYLLMGLCRWEGRTLKAGDRPYDLYTFKDGDDALDRIKVFDNWFNLCFGRKPVWYYRGMDQSSGEESESSSAT